MLLLGILEIFRLLGIFKMFQIQTKTQIRANIYLHSLFSNVC